MKKLFTLIQNNRHPVAIKMLNLENAYTLIKGGVGKNYEQTVANMRAIDGADYQTRKKLRESLKDTLPAIIFNAVCNDRIKTENVTSTTGYIIMDIDGLSDDKVTSEMMANELRDSIYANKNLGVVLSFVSPSGEGVKALVRVPNVTVSNYEDWQACVAYFVNKTYSGIKCDDNAKNITRLCYLSVDHDAKMSTDPNKHFTYTLDDWKRSLEGDKTNGENQEKTKSVGRGYVPCSGDKQKLQQFFIDYATYLSKHMPPVFSDYNSWLALGGHLYYIFDGNATGMQVWEDISRYAPSYDPKDFKSNWKFDATPKNNGGGVLGLVYNQTKIHIKNFKMWFDHELYQCGL